MNFAHLFLIAVTAILAVVPVVAQPSDRTDISHWNLIGDANWRMEEGALVADEGRGHAVSPDQYGNFELSLEFWAGENSNSGIYFRCISGETINTSNCYEANIFDSREDQSGGTGSIVGVAPPSETIKTEGRWNSYQVRAEGNHLVIVLNGITTVDTQHDGFDRGYVALQFAGGGLKFRNVSIQEL